MVNKKYGFYFELEFPEEMSRDEVFEQGQAFVSTDLKDFDEADYFKNVHVVIHMHSGVIFNTGVFREGDKAKKYRDELIIASYGELVEEQFGNDSIDLQECQIIV